MGTIRPFMQYITVEGVDHDDMVQSKDLPPQEIMSLIGASSEDFVQPQYIGAGVIIEVGHSVYELLKPGFKVYYDSRYARKVNEVWVVDARTVMAYEEL